MMLNPAPQPSSRTRQSVTGAGVMPNIVATVAIVPGWVSRKDRLM